MTAPEFSYIDEQDRGMPPLQEDPEIIVAVPRVDERTEKATRVSRILNGFHGMLEVTGKDLANNPMSRFI